MTRTIPYYHDGNEVWWEFHEDTLLFAEALRSNSYLRYTPVPTGTSSNRWEQQ